MKKLLFMFIFFALPMAAQTTANSPMTCTAKGFEDLAAVLATMADNANHLNAHANSKMIPADDRVVYVSKGFAITGKQYDDVMTKSYAEAKSIQLRWDKCEFRRVDANVVAVTAWATASVTDQKGASSSEKDIFTMVFARKGGEWQRVLAHKSQLVER